MFEIGCAVYAVIVGLDPYWNRADECLGTPLDHVFSSKATTSVAARGACESEGCIPGESCPTYVRDVSDHCPVTVDF